MHSVTPFLLNVRRIIRIQEGMLKEICEEYGLSLVEVAILSFLYNNPEKDTAAEVAQLRMLSKGHVSQGVEGLIQKELLRREPDEQDHRRLHLILTPKADPICIHVEKFISWFGEELFYGFSPQEQEEFFGYLTKVRENLKRMDDKKGKA